MARVPTLGISRNVTVPQVPVPVGLTPKGAVIDEMAKGLERLGDYLRPVAVEDSQTRGELEAREALASGERIEPRNAFTASSRAFNAVAARGMAVRAASDAQTQIDTAVRDNGHNPEELTKSLDALRQGYVSELGDFPALQNEFETLFERQSIVAKRTASEAQAQIVIDEDKAAAAKAMEVFERGVSQIAISGGTVDEVAAEMAHLQQMIIEFGPRGEFELNGQEYPADDSRSGTLTIPDIQRAILGTKSNVEVLSIQGEFARSRAKGNFARKFKADLLSGRAPVDPAKGLVLVNQMEAELRSRAAAERSARAAVRTELRAQLRVINTGTSAGFPPAADWDALRATSGNDPALLREIGDAQTRAQAIEASRTLGPAERQDFIDGMTSRAQAVADAGGVDTVGLDILDQLEREQSSILAAISAESTGIDVAEDLLAKTGGLSSPDRIAELRVAAGGKPELLKRVDALEASTKFVAEFRTMTAAQRERGMETLTAEVNRLGLEGKEPRALLAAREAVESDGKMLATLATSDPMQVATLRGVAVPELDFSDPAALSASMAGRVQAAEVVAENYGVKPRLLRPTELVAVEDALGEMSADAKLSLIDGFGSLPDAVQETLADDLVGIGGGFGHIATINRNGNTDAARLILRGQELRANKVGERPNATDRSDARSSVGLDQIQLDPESTALIEATAEAYAIGMANGGEVTAEMMEQGYQRAMFRQEDGTGGLVDSDFGVVMVPGGIDAGSFDDLVSSATDADLAAMNGGVAPRDSFGDVVTAADLSVASLTTIEPGFYMVTLPGGSGVTGDGPGGNFVLDIQALAGERTIEANVAADAAAVVDQEMEAERATIQGIRQRALSNGGGVDDFRKAREAIKALPGVARRLSEAEAAKLRTDEKAAADLRRRTEALLGLSGVGQEGN